MTGPVAVWDTRDGTWFTAPLRQARTDWLNARDLPAADMFRAEFYDDDQPHVRVFTYHVNEDGHKHMKDDRSGPAENPPYDVQLAELPPRDLLRNVGKR